MISQYPFCCPVINDKKSLPNSKSSYSLSLKPSREGPSEPLQEVKKPLPGKLQESHHLLQEYKDNLLKFDNNIMEIKKALGMLKVSLGDFKVH